MKPFIFILSMLMLCACNVRHKVKHTENTEVKVETSSKVEKADGIFENQQEERQLSDSVKVNQLLQTAQIGEQHFQYFTLKNNGNCVENSPIRFVTITDNKGNKTEIPVNDNTELIFNNEKKSKHDTASQHTEENKITKEHFSTNSTVAEIRSEVEEKEVQKDISLTQKDTEVKTERPSFWISLTVVIVILMALTKRK